MAVFLDNLKYMRLYRTQIYLPVKMESRKTGSLIFLFSNNPDTASLLMNHPKTININSFMSYYVEKNVNLYLNESTKYWGLEESISAKERREIPVEQFGLPEERKYPWILQNMFVLLLNSSAIVKKIRSINLQFVL